MKCNLCKTCVEAVDKQDRPTGYCIYGGPFTDFVQDAPINLMAYIFMNYREIASSWSDLAAKRKEKNRV